MVYGESGINIARDAFMHEITSAQLGTSGIEAAETDTSLGGTIVQTLFGMTATAFNRGFKLEYATITGSGQGFTAREMVITAKNGTYVGGVAFPDEEIISTTTIEHDVQNLFIQEL